MDQHRAPPSWRLPALIAGGAVLALLCAGVIAAGAWALLSSGAGEQLSRGRAASSGKGHKDGWSAPSGYSWSENSASILTLRPMDSEIITRFVGRDLGAAAREDAIPGAARVDLFQDAPATTLTRVEVDADRDGLLDERWEVDGAYVIRNLSPGGDGDFSERYKLRDGLWLGAP